MNVYAVDRHVFDPVSIVNGAANDAALAFATQNKTKLMYSAVLDDRVCDDCASHDGEIYNYDDPDIPSLPQHNNCRCRLIPVKDEEKENEKLAMPFNEYLQSLPKAAQRKRLGAAKYDLIKSGQYQSKSIYEPPNKGQRKSMAELTANDKGVFLNTENLKIEAIKNGGNFHAEISDAIAALRKGFDIKTANGTVCHFGESLYDKYALGERKDGADLIRLSSLPRAVEAVKKSKCISI